MGSFTMGKLGLTAIDIWLVGTLTIIFFINVIHMWTKDNSLNSSVSLLSPRVRVSTFFIYYESVVIN